LGFSKEHFSRAALPGRGPRPPPGGPWGASRGGLGWGPSAVGGWAALASPTRQDQGDQSLGYPAAACFKNKNLTYAIKKFQ